jgi:CubicO group peptidase (beta-lactamase class C family)
MSFPESGFRSSPKRESYCALFHGVNGFVQNPSAVMPCLRLLKASLLGILLLIAAPIARGEAQDLSSPRSDQKAADLQRAGLDPDAVQKLIELIKATPPNDFRGMVVMKDGKVVIEEYFNTYWRETVHDIRSAGKSVTALLLGIAIDKGLIRNVNQSIRDFLPVTPGTAPVADRYARITIADLLTMSSGLDADDGKDSSPGNAVHWMARDDWAKFATTLPIHAEPGTEWVYSDVCAMLTGAIIEKVSGMKLSDFARLNLFQPLGIREYYWYTGNGGSTGAAGNLYISTIDFAKIGQLVLDGGRWQEKQIISESWIREIARKRFDISHTNPFSSGYGYFWWLGEKKVGDRAYAFSFASGNGGNVVFVVPGENMVVSLTSSAYGQGYGHQRAHNVFEFILKAIRQP